MPTDIQPYTPAQSFPDIPPGGGGGGGSDIPFIDTTFDETDFESNGHLNMLTIQSQFLGVLEGRIDAQITWPASENTRLGLFKTLTSAELATWVPATSFPSGLGRDAAMLQKSASTNGNFTLPGFWTVINCPGGSVDFAIDGGSSSSNPRPTSANIRLYYRLRELDTIPPFPVAADVDARFQDVDARLKALESRRR